MRIIVNVIKLMVLSILLLLVFAGGLCMTMSPNDVGITVICFVVMLVFGWPAWLILKSFGSKPEEDNEPPSE